MTAKLVYLCSCSIVSGRYHWSPGTSTDKMPYDMLCGFNTSSISIKLFGKSVSRSFKPLCRSFIWQRSRIDELLFSVWEAGLNYCSVSKCPYFIEIMCEFFRLELHRGLVFIDQLSNLIEIVSGFFQDNVTSIMIFNCQLSRRHETSRLPDYRWNTVNIVNVFFGDLRLH